MNLCSKCYKDYLSNKEKEQRQATAADASAATTQVVGTELEAMETDDAGAVATRGECAANDVPTATGGPEAMEANATPASDVAPSPAFPEKEVGSDEEQMEEESKAKSIAAMCVPVPPPPPPEAATSAGEDGEKERRVQKNTSRCMECNKKIGLTGFKCRCGYFFCPTHRHSDTHNCDFDYKAAGRAELAKANPLVVADKVARI